jgi:hypothetical protein
VITKLLWGNPAVRLNVHSYGFQPAQSGGDDAWFHAVSFETLRYFVARAPGPSAPTSTHSSWWSLLLLIPFVALLWVPFYNRIDPAIFGIPFFYWYQFIWVVLTSLIIVIVDSRTREADTSE